MVNKNDAPLRRTQVLYNDVIYRREYYWNLDYYDNNGYFYNNEMESVYISKVIVWFIDETSIRI